MGILKDLAMIFALIWACVTATQLTTDESVDGAGKKAKCIAEIEAQLDREGGIDPPKWLPRPALDVIISLLIDAIKIAMKSDFFGKPSASPPK